VKLVREHINEKFVEDSDSIQDMGIGMGPIIQGIKEKMLLNYNKYGFPSGRNADDITTPSAICQYVMKHCHEYGVDIVTAVINYLNSTGKIHMSRTLLIYFALKIRKKSSKEAVVEWLIDNGAKVKELEITYNMSTKDDKMTQFLIESAMTQKRGKFVKKMLDQALSRALSYHKVNMMQWLLDKGADPSLDKYKVLQWALENDETELVKEMLKYIQNDPKYK
jgi:hypothetical protein